MNNFFAIIFLLSSVKEPSHDSSDLAKFKTFVKSYFNAVGKGDTVFLRNHTIFPIKDSDFGGYISTGKNMPSISSKVYFSHLKIFYKPGEVSAALKDGDFMKELHSKNEYYLDLERPYKSGPAEYLETFRWFFVKKGNDFLFSTFKHEIN